MADPNPSLLAYPEFPEPLTAAAIRQLFTPKPDELRWVRQTSNSPASRLGLLCWLKSFPVLGRFAPPNEIPVPIVAYLAERAGLAGLTLDSYPVRTRVRHRIEIRTFLGIQPWDDAAEALATATMERIVGGRTHRSDLINGAIEALVTANYELPALSTLRRLAGNVHTHATDAWLATVSARLSGATRRRLEALFIVPDDATETAFSKLCKSTKRASRNHLDELLGQLGWLNELALPARILEDIPASRIDAWAEEARRLTATELREYTTPRRHALLCCLLVQTRATRLDDLVTMLIRFMGRIEAKARADLDAWHRARRLHVSQLLGVLREIATARHDITDPESFAAPVDAVLAHAGGAEAVMAACDEHLAKGPDDWRAFLEPHFRAQRSWLLRLAEPMQVEGRSLCVSASIGMCLAGAGITAEHLLRHADAAMYRAKSRGKGQSVAFEPSMLDTVRHRLQIEQELAAAFEREEFLLHYQPIVDLKTGHLLGAEALVRWRHRRLGVMPPAEFIPIAEETGLIVPLTRWVLHQACDDIARARRALPYGEGLRVSVNVSGGCLRHDETIADVERALTASGLDAGSLVLEVTESLLLQSNREIGDRVAALKRLGVRIALDDFGTGYSSLAYLHRFPVDILKMDRSFVQQMGGGDPENKAAALARAILSLAEALGLDTVAEGVETSAQQAALLELGCRTCQGYLFGWPMPLADLMKSEAEALRAQYAATLEGPINFSTTGRFRIARKVPVAAGRKEPTAA